MERLIPRRIPQWKLNAREQVTSLAREGHIAFAELPRDWNDLSFTIGPLIPTIALQNETKGLSFLCTIGEVSDTYGVAEIYEDFPIQGLDVDYELKPLSKVHVSSAMPLSETTSSLQIFNFIKDCSILSLVGLQSLIGLGNLVWPSAIEVSQHDLGPGEENWGNPGVAVQLIKVS